MTNDMPELKPCPFCGGCNIAGHSREFESHYRTYVRCVDCDYELSEAAQAKADSVHKAETKWNTRADTPTSNRVGYEARCADCNRFLQSEETCSCSPTSAERKAEDRRRRHALMGMPDFHTHYQIHGKWAQAHHEAIRAALQQPDTSVAVRVLVHALQLDPDPPEYIGRKYREALRHPAVIAAMKGE